METKLNINFQTGTLEVSGDEKFVKEIFYEFKNSLTNKEMPVLDNIRQTVKNKKEPKIIETKPKKIRKSISSPIFLTDLDLKPKGKQSLKDFCNIYKPSYGFEYNLVFVYYLTKILNMNNININHIYTCYKTLTIKYPNNLYQNLKDTNRTKTWIDANNIEDIKVISVGENYLEHDMLKKKDSK